MQRKLTVVLALSSLITAGAAGTSLAADTTELPVYGVKSSGLDQEQAQKLRRAFGLKDVARSEYVRRPSPKSSGTSTCPPSTKDRGSRTRTGTPPR